MNNTKKPVHASGPLAALLQSNQIKTHTDVADVIRGDSNNKAKLILETQSGIQFSENELIEVPTEQCRPWKYANRDESELGDLDALIQSIQQNKQLQPALIRPIVDDNYKYEVIFGRRRLLACQKLGINLLAICKEFNTIQDAISVQDAENKFRNDVSDYSNAKLYKRLIEDGVFKNESQLAKKLNISTSSLSDIMSFTKIPNNVLSLIPDIHSLSRNLALKINALLREHGNIAFERIAPMIGKEITSAAQLELHVRRRLTKTTKSEILPVQQFRMSNGRPLFTLKHNSKGNITITFSKELSSNFDLTKNAEQLVTQLESCFDE
jgi:ParB family transcriptional regulator, chromosome partitioning protein